MSVFGITNSGFNAKRLRDIQDSMKDRLLQLKDPDTGESLQIDWNEDDPIIQIINAICDELAAEWQVLSECYSQFNPLLASGNSLSGLVQLNGILRKTGSPSTVVLKFIGEPGILIPKGTEVTDENNEIVWVTASPLTISSNSEGYVSANSKTNGAFIYVAGTINTLIGEISGFASVVNPSDSVPGVLDESDADLRMRRSKATETPSIGIPESIYGSLINLDAVTYVKIYCNRENAADDKGIPAKSIACIVRGGSDEEIAKNIFLRSSLGIGFYGTTTVNVVDSMQVATSISFSRPVEVAIDVEVIIDEIEGSAFPADAEEQIQANIVNYAANGPAGIGITGAGFDSFGFPPAENIVASRLYIPVNAVKGVKIISLKIAKHGEAVGNEDIEIAWNEVGIFTGSNITVIKGS